MSHVKIIKQRTCILLFAIGVILATFTKFDCESKNITENKSLLVLIAN